MVAFLGLVAWIVRVVLLGDLHVLLVLWVLHIAKDRHDCRVLHLVRSDDTAKCLFVYCLFRSCGGFGSHITVLVAR